MQMSREVRDVFALAALIAGYGLLLWLYEAKIAAKWGEDFAHEPKAIFARQDRDRLIAEELEIEPTPTFTPPADEMKAAPLEGDTDGSD